MDVTFLPLSDKDEEELVRFLTTNSFPYHRITAPSEELVRRLLIEGRFDGDGVCTYWVFGDNQRMGLVILEDLGTPTPVLDLRLVERFRGRGNAVPVLKSLTGKVFDEHPGIHRFAGRTREDNIAMRKTLLRSGFLKEAHYREDWQLEDGRYVATVVYAILRRDWEQGTLSRFEWEELEQPRQPR
ncbi:MULTISPECIES: GNAT family N-acetyltransferase [unclassified Arthrobacter]|nr:MULTISPECIES: GNAT family protein [unclassified Arthrobacter]MCC3280065.1 GNAT family N-acetyltransferase [Arthrobacter sp. zg-Y40]MCC9178188.1 GNAT family N-acetyltransferase [Arthrobacter sp. zg-Y750]MDK1328583.1 GNAT family protein [Arthrobacter sp. zg-Y1143]